MIQPYLFPKQKHVMYIAIIIVHISVIRWHHGCVSKTVTTKYCCASMPFSWNFEKVRRL